jgi:nucleoprotein TPR
MSTKILDVLSFGYVILLRQEAADLKQKLEKCEFDLENTRKSSELSLIPLTNVAADSTDLVDSRRQELYDF